MFEVRLPHHTSSAFTRAHLAGVAKSEHSCSDQPSNEKAIYCLLNNKPNDTQHFDKTYKRHENMHPEQNNANKCHQVELTWYVDVTLSIFR